MSSTDPGHRRDPEDRSVRRAWWLLSGAFIALVVLALARALTTSDPLAWGLLVAAGVASLAAIAHRDAVVGLEARGRAEAENLARILRGLSRSVSVDAIVGAIVDDLAEGTGADHVVVVRRRADGGVLEATLVTRRAGVPNSSTVLPLGDLDLGAGTSMVAVPMAVDPADVEPAAVLLGTRAAPVAPIRPGEWPSAPTLRRPGMDSRDDRLDEGGRPGRAIDRRVRAGGSPAGLRPRGGSGLVGMLADVGRRRTATESYAARAPRAEVIGSGPSAQVAARIAERVKAVYGLSHTLAAPLRTEAGVIGAIVVSRRDRDAWDLPARRLLEGAAIEASAAFARAYSFREAEANASTDPLTGLPNRRYFDEFCGLLARRRRAGDAVAVLMVDIDKFKVLNDTFGHPVGDVVLHEVANAIVSAVREEDVPARIGGEEFAVLLRNPGPDVALEVGERVCAAVRALDLSHHGVPGISVSVGVANATEADEPIPAIIERADQALLRAKRAGRDRVIAG
ncbi:MAG: GGDEF domain-containing protein [Chloroflexota bacterium]|nr:MAG: GGDEF domain-containing protein [Chloroflexota bacterium]